MFAIRDSKAGYPELDLHVMDIADHCPDDLPLEDVMEFSLKNTTLASFWVKPEVSFNDTSKTGLPNPDISRWFGAALILSSKAHRFLNDSLKTYGEFLPVDVDNETYYVFNCLHWGDEDSTASVVLEEDGVKYGVEKLVFLESAEESLVAKSKLESGLTLFANERFKEAVLGFGLTGIEFDCNLIEEFS